jgi:hypothetical protein
MRARGLRLLLLLAGLALTGFGASALLAQGDESGEHHQASGWVSFLDPHNGLRGSVPSSWHRGPASLQPKIVSPRQILTVATFSPHREPPNTDCGYLHHQEIRDVGSRGAFVTLFVGGANPNLLASTHMRPKAFRLKASDLIVDPPTRYARQWILSFKAHHRYFTAGVVLGPHAARAVRRDARLVLDSLRLGALHLSS